MGQVRLLLLPLPLLLLPGLRQKTLHFGHPLHMQQPAGRHNLLRLLMQVVIPGQAKLDPVGSRIRAIVSSLAARAAAATAALCLPPAARSPFDALFGRHYLLATGEHFQFQALQQEKGAGRKAEPKQLRHCGQEELPVDHLVMHLQGAAVGTELHTAGADLQTAIEAARS